MLNRLGVSLRVATIATLALTLALGAWLRVSDANWDRGDHLHPDERYLSIVADNIHWPGSLGQYLDVHDSPLSPYNTEPGRSYVYGTLPLFGTKAAAAIVGREGYGRLNVLGRTLSAILDTASILLVFFLARMLFEREGARAATAGALLAAALYAGTVAAVQQSHFFTVDPWLVFFTLLAITLAVLQTRRAATGHPPRFPPLLIGVGAAVGLAVACKVSGALVAVPVAVALLGQTALTVRWADGAEAVLRFAAGSLAVLVSAYVAYRAVDPYVFAHSSWLDLTVDGHLRAALGEQHDLLGGKILFPPAYQWLLSKPVWAPVENLVVWQLGPALGAAALAGVVLLCWRVGASLVEFVRGRGNRVAEAPPGAVADLTVRLLLLIFVLAVFFYFATLFAHTGRYLVSILPLLCVIAATAVVALGTRRPLAGALAAVLVVVPTFLYAFAFHHVYAATNTRVAASEWIVRQVPEGSTLANEHWDDSLPVGGAAAAYKGVVLPVFDADDDTKIAKLYDGLSKADYYVVSSPRAWKTIGRLPGRFPIMARYYRLLFEGRLGFTRVARFESYPELFGVQLRDQRAEEAFWVYDHPPVSIFRRSERLSAAEFRRRLCRSLHAPGCPSTRSS